MLVVARKKNESIVINNNIVVTVVEVRGDRVRIGIDHPKEIPVHRREVYDAIHREYGLSDFSTPGSVVSPEPSASAPPPAEPLSDKQEETLVSALLSRLVDAIGRVTQAMRGPGLK